MQQTSTTFNCVTFLLFVGVMMWYGGVFLVHIVVTSSWQIRYPAGSSRYLRACSRASIHQRCSMMLVLSICVCCARVCVRHIEYYGDDVIQKKTGNNFNKIIILKTRVKQFQFFSSQIPCTSTVSSSNLERTRKDKSNSNKFDNKELK